MVNEESARLRVQKLYDISELDQSRFRIDLDELLKVRNEVAHFGIMQKKREGLIFNLLDAVCALQLILLRRLGYSGRVMFHEDGYRTYVPISSLFNGGG